MDLYENIKNKQLKIVKIKAKINTIETALKSTGNNYSYTKLDLDIAVKELSSTQRRLLELVKKKNEFETINKMDIPVIDKFLECRKVYAFDYYCNEYDNLLALKQEYDENYKKACEYCNANNLRLNKNIRKNFNAVLSEYTEKMNDFSDISQKAYAAGSKSPSSVILNLIDEEYSRKKLFILRKIYHAVGDVTDATYLSLDDSDEITGCIYGINGGATIQTVSCGGWNVQRPHFRIIVNKK